MIKEYDVVKAKKDLSDSVLQGCEGAVLLIYQEPALGYEVEFVDSNGDTLDVLIVYLGDIEVSE
ncbi:DUF4926 domain-containing protein [Budviciaceae bacterium CWB-B4]|uniref:DUF4926 domain-containing protein n=1 Tax=Limnobaculum xujianqingii TaxID=2738837 RepID=A0A9D7FYB4_9GAMM|nr:DUF4926 domain-containing protein [Limnobaculum xujianqingii]MBK5073443.1 DUF4926 domain-containing protein [Limnobaculum xujianqingii]MBK5176826.1 DUF4926 domain-containing protein [Limnobaculum xujianqingii]